MTTFLSLPAELRNQIYVLVLSAPEEYPRLPHHPWERPESKHLSLFLTNRQICTEASYLLWREHIDAITFHFSNGRDLYQFTQTQLKQNPRLEDARYRLCVTVYDRSASTEMIKENLPIVELLFGRDEDRPKDYIHRWCIDLWDELASLDTIPSAHRNCLPGSECVDYTHSIPRNMGQGPDKDIGDDARRKEEMARSPWITFFSWQTWMNGEWFPESMGCHFDIHLPSSAGPEPRMLSPGRYPKKYYKVVSEALVIEGRLRDVRLSDLDEGWKRIGGS